MTLTSPPDVALEPVPAALRPRRRATGAAPLLSVSRRTRATPFTSRVEAAGVKGYTVYNHMLLPTVFESLEADYRHLKEHVQVWDVSCERQIELRGPDCARLAQMLTPRDLRRIQIGQCLYAPVVDENGGVLNDPVILKLAEDKWRISIADSDIQYWAQGLAVGRGLEVDVFEADVSLLAIQGPKADSLLDRVFGEGASDIRFFRAKQLIFDDVELLVARSGYSKQGGFEIYIEDADQIAERLWDALFDAGRDLSVRPGGPNLIERIEGGLLSYGNDMTRANTPFECGLDAFCTPETAFGCVGRPALLRLAETGPARRIRGLAIQGASLPPCREPWPVLAKRGRAPSAQIGEVTSAAWSPDFGTNVAIGMLDTGYWKVGERVKVDTPRGVRVAEVRDLPFAE